MRCSKSCYLRDLELVDLFDNGVIEQVYYKLTPFLRQRPERMQPAH